ncbi:helix-turn-helix transcriptional regulator [Vibrio cholerae]
MNGKDNHYLTDLSKAEKRAFAREELVFNVTEDLLVIMEDMNISKSDLARTLGKSKSYVSQVLSGSRNMTLGSLSDICFALGFKPEIRLPVEEQKHYSEFFDRHAVYKYRPNSGSRHLRLVSNEPKYEDQPSIVWYDNNLVEACS